MQIQYPAPAFRRFRFLLGFACQSESSGVQLLSQKRSFYTIVCTDNQVGRSFWTVFGFRHESLQSFFSDMSAKPNFPIFSTYILLAFNQ